MLAPMTSAQLRQLAADPRFIAGIYNYCDRWCERCSLSHRCLNYAMEKAEDDGDPAARDLANQKFWNKLHASFQLTMQMLHEDAQRLGIDLQAPGTGAAADARERQVRRRAARNRPLSSAARDYGMAVHKWFRDSSALFKAKGADLVKQARLEIGRPLDEAEAIREMLELIDWYHLFIHVKLARAIGSQAEEELETDAELRALMRDADGSAKIALIGMDRSLAAWAALRPHFSEQEDKILDFQLQLARLRRDAERLFPNARAFVRPGFDEGAERLEVGG
jgi:hypothetical protein